MADNKKNTDPSLEDINSDDAEIGLDGNELDDPEFSDMDISDADYAPVGIDASDIQMEDFSTSSSLEDNISEEEYRQMEADLLLESSATPGPAMEAPEASGADDAVPGIQPDPAGVALDMEEERPSLEELNDLKGIEDSLLMLMVLKKAKDQGILADYHEALYNGSTLKDPVAEIATFAQPENKGKVEDMYPELWAEVQANIAKRQIDAQWREQLLDEAGITEEQYAQMPASFHRSMALSAEFESVFPPQPGQGLGQRLKESKDVLISGLTSEKGQKTINYLGWGLSIATGGVAVRLGLMGVKSMASNLMENESVKRFAKEGMEVGVHALKGMGVPVDKISDGMVAAKERTRSVWDSKAVRFSAGALALVATALIIQEFDVSKVLDAPSPESISAKVADLGMVGEAASVGMQGVDEAVRATKEVLGAGYEYGSEKVAGAASVIADIASDTGQTISQAFMDNALENAHQELADITGVYPNHSDTGVLDRTSVANSELGVEPLSAAERDAIGTSTSGIMNPDADEVFSLTSVSGNEAAPIIAEETAQNTGEVVYTIEKGDSLWKIAENQIIEAGGNPSSSNIDATWRAIYEANKEVIGNNPHLIQPNVDLKIDPSLLSGVPEIAVDTPAVNIPSAYANFDIDNGIERMEDLLGFEETQEQLAESERMEDLLGFEETQEQLAESERMEDLLNFEETQEQLAESALSSDSDNPLPVVTPLDRQGAYANSVPDQLPKAEDPGAYIKGLMDKAYSKKFDTGGMEP